MGENIISWNFVNWVTIVLMAAVGFLILAAITQGIHALRGNSDAPNPLSDVGALG